MSIPIWYGVLIETNTALPVQTEGREMGSMKITDGKGVHFTFENGITISIQIGGGNYCDNYNEPIGMRKGDGYVLPPSSQAEIAVWSMDGEMTDIDGDIVKGYLPIDQVLEFTEFLRSLPSDLVSSELDLAMKSFVWR